MIRETSPRPSVLPEVKESDINIFWEKRNILGTDFDEEREIVGPRGLGSGSEGLLSLSCPGIPLGCGLMNGGDKQICNMLGMGPRSRRCSRLRCAARCSRRRTPRRAAPFRG